MRYVDEFRDPELIRRAAEEIRALVEPGRTYRIMEICGGHTHAIYRFSLDELLPDGIRLIHGPGCPVCVLPMGRTDEGMALAERPEVIFTAFGDVMRVPGTRGSPLRFKARGADIRMVYSPLDALRLATDNPDREVVFFAIGFETTAPSTALTLRRARLDGVANFSVHCNHVSIIPAIESLLDSPDLRLDAFIGPGHVSTIIGCEPYEFVARDHRKPFVVSGFEPLDLLQSIVMILRQLREGRAAVENQYGRAVPREGNRPALDAMREVFEPRDSFEWRGLGSIAGSALRIRDDYAEWDAEVRFPTAPVRVADPEEAQCGEVLRGALEPHRCRLFGRECDPERPIGALMVSSEGACAAYHAYVHRRTAAGSRALRR